MSDPKRANLITVSAPKVTKNNVAKTVRLMINLDESNERKYSELNYKKLVSAEENKKKVENGKTSGLDPFSDNDDDVVNVARKFEQKYGGKRTYGKKGKNKRDEFADIGAGYDENDSFIDNTDGYDEMFPPEIDTYLGGFYINCGQLEFKSVPENQTAISDAEPGRRNKRRISSSSSEDETSESSSESESQDEKDPKPVVNGVVDSHKTEHRKKKNKNIDKKKAKKIKRTDSSAATSGKQTSDDNVHGDAESDSRTSQSDSLASKPAPSSENPITSDSSRDTESKAEVKIPSAIVKILEELESTVSKHQLLDKNSNTELDSKTDPFIAKLDRALGVAGGGSDSALHRAVMGRAARALRVSRSDLLRRITQTTQLAPPPPPPAPAPTVPSAPTAAPVSEPSSNYQAQPPVVNVLANHTPVNTTNTSSSTASTNKRKPDDSLDELNVSKLTPELREEKIIETIKRLRQLINDRKPSMMANYHAECERVQEERKKIMIAASIGTGSDGGGASSRVVEKRLPKRRFPWCARSRALLARLRMLAVEGAGEAGVERAHSLFANTVLPLFPTGFVRMPTLLRQADFSKEMKNEAKRQRLPPPCPPQQPQPATFTEPIHFPSSLTVTAASKNSSQVNSEISIVTEDKDKHKGNLESASTLKALTKYKVKEKDHSQTKEDKKDDNLINIPTNNIGSITITPVLTYNKTEKKVVNSNISDKQKEPLLRVKSPAALNEMVKKEKHKKLDKNNMKDKKIDTPLHIETSFIPKKDNPSPRQTKLDETTQKQIDTMRVAENNIPRPALVPVHHSPTFAKPDKRAPEVKKKKDIVIVSDMDPLADVPQDPVAVDDSSSDVEVIEEKSVKSDYRQSENKSDSVPSKDKSARENHKKESVKCKDSESNKEFNSVGGRDNTLYGLSDPQFIDVVLRLEELENSRKKAKSFEGVINSAQN